MEPQMERIKALATGNCPHCSKEIFIEIINYPSQVAGIFSKENFEDAKKHVVEVIGAMDMSDEAKAQAKEWVENKDVLFGPNEIQEIINNIKKEHGVEEKIIKEK